MQNIDINKTKNLTSIKTLRTKAGGGDLESRKGSEPDPEPTLQLGKPTSYVVSSPRCSAGVVPHSLELEFFRLLCRQTHPFFRSDHFFNRLTGLNSSAYSTTKRDRLDSQEGISPRASHLTPTPGQGMMSYYPNNASKFFFSILKY